MSSPDRGQAGRPPSGLEPHSESADPRRQRVAWLLRQSRYYGADERWAKGGAFAAAFHGGSWPTRLSPTQISRWENAENKAPYRAVRRYEELLGLRPGAMVAAADMVHRYWATRPTGPPTLRRPDGGAGLSRLDDLLAAACSRAPVSGADWDDLTGILAGKASRRRWPAAPWAELAGRLLAEMVIADGVPWMRRFESLNRLLNHPHGAPAAVDACASLARDRSHLVLVEVVCALDASGRPDATGAVLGQLDSPTNDQAFYGALLACVRKLDYRHFDLAQARTVAGVAGELLAGEGVPEELRSLAADLIRRMPARARDTADRVLPWRVRNDPSLRPVFAGGRLVGEESSAALVGRVEAAVLAGTSREIPRYHDTFLPVLLDEILHSPVPDVRLYTSMLLAASPYRPAIAAALAGELRRNRATRSVPLAVALLGALRILGGDAERPLVQGLILDPVLPGEVSIAAAQAIGHMAGRSDPRFWSLALDRYGLAWRRDRDPVAASVLRQLVYALGIARAHDLLERIRSDPCTPGPARRASAWWLAIPAVITESAQT
ncbi:MAG: hypothetical protein ACJ73S_21650 [Mycobacteriales bacterium]